MTTPNHDPVRLYAEEAILIPEDVRTIAGAVDRLAASDAGSAPEALEARVFDATRRIVAQGLGAASVETHSPVYRIGRPSLRLAAAVAIMLTGGTLAGWLALRSHQVMVSGNGAVALEQPAQIQHDLDSWLAEASALDTGASSDLTALNSELATLAEHSSFLPPIDDSTLEESL